MHLFCSVQPTQPALLSASMCSLSTEGEDLRDQESVSRVLAELLDNQEGLFDSEDDDVSTTNDYSSINEQVPFVSNFFLFSIYHSLSLSLLYCIWIRLYIIVNTVNVHICFFKSFSIISDIHKCVRMWTWMDVGGLKLSHLQLLL